MKKGRVAKRDREADDGNGDPLVQAIEGIHIPDHGDAIVRAIEGIDTSGISDIESAIIKLPNYSEDIERLANVVQQGFADLIEALKPPPPSKSVFLDASEFRVALCGYVYTNRGYIGGETIRFAAVPNLESDVTEMYDLDDYAKGSLMAVRVHQWNLLREADDDLFAQHFNGTSSYEDTTFICVANITKKLSSCGKRIDITAVIRWHPHQKNLEAHPKMWRRMCCKRAAVAVVGMRMFRRGSLAGFPQDVINLLAKHVVATDGSKKWKIPTYLWF